MDISSKSSHVVQPLVPSEKIKKGTAAAAAAATPAMSTRLARLRNYPFTLSLFTATTKTAAADVLTQLYIEPRSSGSDAQTLSLRRIGVFTVFGFWYLGGFQYWLYVKCFARWFPSAKSFGDHATIAARLNDRKGLIDLAKQVAAGNFLHIPFLFLPSFYVTQEVCMHGTDASPAKALQSYRSNMWNDCVAAWTIWIPGHAIFFSVPLWLRLPVNHAMSFCYVCVLSYSRGQGAASDAT